MSAVSVRKSVWNFNYKRFYFAREKTILFLIAFVLTIVGGFRAVWWQTDFLTILIGLVVWICWFIFLGHFAELVTRGSFEDVYPLLLARVHASFSLLVLVSLFVVAAGLRGEVINIKTGETTFSHPYLLTTPFSSDIVFMSRDFKEESVEVELQTTDQVPLTCTVRVDGVTLDDRDIPALEQNLVMNNLGENPVVAITERLRAQIKLSAAEAFAGFDSVQLANPSYRFKIPYEVGTPLGDMLAQNFLRWKDGSVSYFCRVTFNS